jgi:hypothetical protein
MKFVRCFDFLGIGWPRVGPNLSLETKRRVELLFRQEEQSAVTGLLVLRCGYSIPGFKRAGEPDVERARFAVLKLSNGSLDELRRAIELAHLDVRDLLVSSGFTDVTEYQNWVPKKKW